MEFDDMLYIAFIIIFIIGSIGMLIFLINSTDKYYELRGIINNCNSDFGEEKWTFKERDGYYGCKSIIQISTESTSCSINGVPINCSQI